MCRVLKVSRQGYHKHQKTLQKPPKHAELLAEIEAIIGEDEFNDSYGKERLHDALVLREHKVSLSTVYRVCRENNLLRRKKCPKGLTKADKAAQKSDDLLGRDFDADAPNKKLVSDITQLPCANGTLYISAVFDCFDNACLGVSMDANMETPLVIQSVAAAIQTHGIAGAVFHTDRGSQYTSCDFRAYLKQANMIQSMNSAAGRCHDNAKCESMWARFKVEAIYGRYNTKHMRMEEVKTLVFRYFMGYWNNRRICHSIGGTPPMLKRRRFFLSSGCAA
jgi:transposase InsO family protein